MQLSRLGLLSIGAAVWIGVAAALPAEIETPEPDYGSLRILALDALGEGNLDKASETWLRMIHLDPTKPAPLAQVRLHLDSIPDRGPLLSSIEEVSAMALPPETRRIADALRLDLYRKLGRTRDTIRLSDVQGCFRAFARLSFPKAPLDPFAFRYLPYVGRRDDITLVDPMPAMIQPDRWHTGAKSAMLWGAFELSEAMPAQVILESYAPSRVFVDGAAVLDLDPELGLRTGRAEAQIPLAAGRHVILVISARGPDSEDSDRGAADWELRLLLQAEDGSALPVVPSTDLSAGQDRDFAGPSDLPELASPVPVVVGTNALDELDTAALELERGDLALAEDRLTTLAASMDGALPQAQASDRPDGAAVSVVTTPGSRGAAASGTQTATTARLACFVDLYLAMTHRISAAQLGSQVRHLREASNAIRHAVARPDAPAFIKLQAALDWMDSGERIRSAALLRDPGGGCLREVARARWLGKFGLEEDQVDALQKAFACGPQFLESGFTLARLLDKHGHAAEALDVARRTVRENSDSEELRRWVVLKLAGTSRTEEASRICRAPDVAAGPVDEELCDAAVRMRSGEIEAARGEYEVAVKLAPWNAEAAHGLADALGGLGETSGAARQNTAAEQLDGTGRGSLPNLIAMLDTPLAPLLQAAIEPPPPSAPNTTQSDPLPIDPVSPSLLRPAPEVLRGATAIQLLDIDVISVEEGRQYREYYHGALQALDAASRDRAGELSVPGDATLLHAMVHLPDGRTLLPERIQSDGSSKVISFYGLEDGAIADWAWENAARPIESIDTNFFFAAPGMPLLLSRLCLAGDVSFTPIDIRVRNADRVVDKNAVTNSGPVRCWERRELPPAAVDPDSTEFAAIEPRVSISFRVSDWDLGPELLRRLMLAERRDPRLIRRAEELLAEKGRRASDVYQLILAQVPEGSDAESPADALTLGKGTAEQRVGLAKVLCDVAGIEAELVAAFEAERQPGEHRARPRFGLLALSVRDPDSGEPRLWSFGSSTLRAQDVEPPLLGSTLVSLVDGRLVVRPEGGSRTAERSYDTKVDVKVSDQGSATVDGVLEAHGVAAAALREARAEGRSPSDLAQSWATRLFPALRLERGDILHDGPDADAFELHFSGSIESLLPLTTPARFRPWPVPIELSKLVPTDSRSGPLALELPALTERIRIRYRLQEGRALRSEPASFFSLGPLGAYALSFSVDAEGITVERSAVLPSQIVDPSDFGELRKLALAIDEAESQSIEVIRRAPTANEAASGPL